MWIFGILFIIIWGIAEKIGLSIGANKYHQSEEYQRMQRNWDMWEKMANGTWDYNQNKKD